MRLIICLILACFTAPAFAEESSFRFGGQVSANSFRLSDPDGPTASGSGSSFGLIGLYDTGRNARFKLDVTHYSYTLAGSTSNVGQEVSSTGGAISFQKMWRLSRDFKPWFGAGLGYASSTYRNRYTLTPSTLYSVPLKNRSSSDFAFLLNANAEWELNRDFNIGLQGQLTRAFGSSTSAFGVGIYIVY